MTEYIELIPPCGRRLPNLLKMCADIERSLTTPGFTKEESMALQKWVCEAREFARGLELKTDTKEGVPLIGEKDL